MDRQSLILDAYFWFRYIGVCHLEALRLAYKEANMSVGVPVGLVSIEEV